MRKKIGTAESVQDKEKMARDEAVSRLKYLDKDNKLGKDHEKTLNEYSRYLFDLEGKDDIEESLKIDWKFRVKLKAMIGEPLVNEVFGSDSDFKETSILILGEMQREKLSRFAQEEKEGLYLNLGKLHWEKLESQWANLELTGDETLLRPSLN